MSSATQYNRALMWGDNEEVEKAEGTLHLTVVNLYIHLRPWLQTQAYLWLEKRVMRKPDLEDVVDDAEEYDEEGEDADREADRDDENENWVTGLANLDKWVMSVRRDAGQGLGKTQLAVELCNRYDDDWSAEEKATLDPDEAIHLLQNVDHESSILLDEIGRIADNRRSQSSTSVQLTQLWQMMRFKNLLMFATIPSPRMLDIRLLEMCDVRIHVVKQGLCKVYQYSIKDSDPKGQLRPQLKQFYEFPPIDGDPDYEYLSEQKADRFGGKGGDEYVPKSKMEEELEETREDLRQELREKWVRTVYENTKLSQADVGELHGIVYGEEITQQAVSNLL